MSTTPPPITRRVPKARDMFQDVEQAFANDELNLLLNQQPNPKWVLRHPQIGHEYLPIDKVEFMLTYIFQLWKREVLQVQVVLNSIVATVRLWYLHPVTGEWMFHDGVGAMPIAVEKNCKAMDWDHLQGMSIQKSAPGAISYALSNAAEKLGKVFGKDLGRKNTSDYKPTFEGEPASTTPKQPEQPAQPATTTVAATAAPASGTADLSNVEDELFF